VQKLCALTLSQASLSSKWSPNASESESETIDSESVEPQGLFKLLQESGFKFQVNDESLMTRGGRAGPPARGPAGRQAQAAQLDNHDPAAVRAVTVTGDGPRSRRPGPRCSVTAT
jgi:hypothetical protein